MGIKATRRTRACKRHVSSRDEDVSRYSPVEERECDARTPRGVRGSPVCAPDNDPDKPSVARATVGKGELERTRTRAEGREDTEDAVDAVCAEEAKAMVAGDAKEGERKGEDVEDDERRDDRS